MIQADILLPFAKEIDSIIKGRNFSSHQGPFSHLGRRSPKYMRWLPHPEMQSEAPKPFKITFAPGSLMIR